MNLFVTSIDDNFSKLIEKENGLNWGINLEHDNYITLFDKEKLVYLTGDTEDDID